MNPEEEFAPEAVLALCEALPRQAPRASLWSAIENRIARIDRFERFVARLAALLDTTIARARAYLQDIDTLASWNPGPGPRSLAYPLDGGPQTAGAIVGFIKLEAGSTFPRHTHHGEEIVFVLQGALRDEDGRVFRPGQECAMPASSTHEVHAEPGEDSIYFVRIMGEVEIGGQRIGPDDLRL